MDDKSRYRRDLFDNYREQIMYCVFGVSTTLICWLVYSICERFIGLNLYYCGMVSWAVAVVIAFVTNKLWVFHSKSWAPELVAKEAVTFFGGRAITGVLETLAVPLLVDAGFNMTIFNVRGLPAKMAVTVAFVILNYFMSKFISFRHRKKAV